MRHLSHSAVVPHRDLPWGALELNSGTRILGKLKISVDENTTKYELMEQSSGIDYIRVPSSPTTTPSYYLPT